RGGKVIDLSDGLRRGRVRAGDREEALTRRDHVTDVRQAPGGERRNHDEDGCSLPAAPGPGVGRGRGGTVKSDHMRSHRQRERNLADVNSPVQITTSVTGFPEASQGLTTEV